jgi:wobble nucleotide-excising tRNase
MFEGEERSMISRLQLLRNIGQFDSVTCDTSTELAKLTLVYAENGRGKTTLSAILRSLSTGEALPILERHRLGASNPPEAVVAFSGDPQPARFQKGNWTRTCPDMAVFDDMFIDKNVYSGLEVGPGHRQSLHGLILGEQGVALARRVVDLAEKIRICNTDLRTKKLALQNVERHGLTVEDFCALSSHGDLDEAITTAEKLSAAIVQAEAIRTTEPFAPISLPKIDVSAVRALLAKTIPDIETEAMNMVRAHFADLGKGAEGWVATGMALASPEHRSGSCPFCDQKLSTSTMFTAYQSYFADAYKKA